MAEGVIRTVQMVGARIPSVTPQMSWYDTPSNRSGRKIEILRLHPLLAVRSQAPSGRMAGYGWKCRLAIVSILEDILFVACGGAAAGAVVLAVHLRAGLLTRFFPSSGPAMPSRRLFQTGHQWLSSRLSRTGVRRPFSCAASAPCSLRSGTAPGAASGKAHSSGTVGDSHPVPFSTSSWGQDSVTR